MRTRFCQHIIFAFITAFVTVAFDPIAHGQLAERAELPVQVVSEWDLVLQALEVTPPLVPTTNRLSGSFYTIQHRGDWPPLPGNPWKLPFWKLV